METFFVTVGLIALVVIVVLPRWWRGMQQRERQRMAPVRDYLDSIDWAAEAEDIRRMLDAKEASADWKPSTMRPDR